MTLVSASALFAAMLVLAAVPSTSVLAVTARSAAGGFGHGAATAAGIVLGDLLFVLLAVFGLALLVETMGSAFSLVKYLGAAWLIALGIAQWRSRGRARQTVDEDGSSLLSSFMAGLLITLADQKAVLFYLGFLPAFVDLAALSAGDVAAIALITILAVGGVKLAYAYVAGRARTLLGGGVADALSAVAAGVMIAAGAALLVTA
ncbi:MAG: LysE family transporter [Pseudomonadota bacterium]